MIDLMKGGCLELMSSIPDGSVDMILCDLPYGRTACKWDSVIPFEPLWAHYKRVIKTNGAIVLFGSQPFTSALVMSNPKMFRYDLKWIKKAGTGFYHSNKMPLRAHEDISVFYNRLPTYNPQKTKGLQYKKARGSEPDIYVGECYKGKDLFITDNKTGDRYPLSWIEVKRDKNKFHPTQKPVPLLEYLIKTYTNESETVLDNTMGSGSTGVAAVNLNRSFIGIELDDGYFDIAKNRINEALMLKDEA